MIDEGYKRKLTAILSADVKGYSLLMGEDEAETVKTLTSYRKIMGEMIEQHRGRLIDSPGDNILAEFASVVDAVQCAVAAQNEFKAQNAERPENRRMEFRIGVNLGDVIEEEGHIYGDGVNIAARLEALAEPGGICISKTAFDHIETKLPLGYEYLGDQTVKNIKKPVGAYKVLMEPRVTVAGEKATIRKVPFWRHKPVLVCAIVVVLVIISFVVWYVSFRPPPIEPASKEKMAYPLPEKPSIAVLPFTNMSGDPKQEYFSDGITEEIITGLSKVPRLFVIARNSTFTYKGKPVKVQQVAEELGVQYVLEGSVQKANDRVRITAQLIDATTGNHLWAEKYDRALKDIFDLQDEIMMKVIVALQVNLTEGEQALIVAGGTSNFEAYTKFLQGLEYAKRFNREGNLLARKMAQEIIALDPTYSIGYRLLATTHLHDVRLGISTSPGESLAKAAELYQNVIDMDPSDAVAHGFLGMVYTLMRQYEKGISEAEKAVILNPNAADAQCFFGTILHHNGRHDEAIQAITKAIRLNPFPPNWYFMNLGRAYSHAGKYGEAIAALQKALRMSPDNLPAHTHLAATYGLSGREQEARAQATEILRINPKFSLHYFAKTTPYKNPADKELVINALRKAGLPATPPPPLSDKPSIAVLPFTNMSGDPEQEYFSDGITEEIITALSKTPKLFVIARNSTFTYKGKPVKVQQVGRELGVKYVLEGSVRKAENRMRITAQLVDAQSGNHLWAERYDRELKDTFAIQDEITLEIIKAMQVELTMGETARVTGRGTKNLDAYLKALHAQEEWLRLDKEGSMKARQLATQAIALDPEYGYPYAILAWCHMLDVVRYYSASPEESMRLAVEAIQKALALDPSDHRIHRILSNLYVMQGKHDEAIASSKRALELCPGGAGAYVNLGTALLFACRPLKAVSMLEKAIQLDPFPHAVCHRNLAMAYSHVGRYDDAIEQGEKAFRGNPKDLTTPFVLVFAYAKLGRREEARTAAAEVLRINPRFSLDSMAKMRAKMFAAECHADRVYGDIEFLRKADVGLN